MSDEKLDDIEIEELLIDEDFKTIMSEEEGEALRSNIDTFVRYVSKNKDKPLDEVLFEKLKQEFPDKSDSELKEIVEDTNETLKRNEESKASLEKATSKGMSKEAWFASEVSKATSNLSAQESVVRLEEIDEAINSANINFDRLIKKADGTVNMNPSLDGFIAEGLHAETFNINAEANNSNYRAKVLEAGDKGFKKNSVDIVIFDKRTNAIKKRYQSKYCKDVKSTIKAFKDGDYRGQRKLVPEEQASMIKNATAVIEAPDGTTSIPLTKKKAQEIKKDVQSGKEYKTDWSSVNTKILSKSMAKEIGAASLKSAAVGAGFKITEKILNDEKIDADEVVDIAIETGVDTAVKSAATCGIKTAAEKGALKSLSKGVSTSTCANIAFVAVENAKVMSKVGSGELNALEGVDKCAETTVATVASVITGGKGATIGATIGSVVGPIGTAVGSVVGGIVASIAGNETSKKVYSGLKKVAKKGTKVVKTVCEKAVSSVKSKAKSAVSSVCSFFGF